MSPQRSQCGSAALPATSQCIAVVLLVVLSPFFPLSKKSEVSNALHNEGDRKLGGIKLLPGEWLVRRRPVEDALIINQGSPT
jgi:hypothetical protein